MCGDLDPEDQRESHLYQRFVSRSHALIGPAPAAPGADDDLNSYLDSLFSRVLQRCVQDNEGAEAGGAYRQMAMQSLVLARLAGFLAGHVGLNEDPMRKVMEAVMLGYQEAQAKPQSDHEHDHDHGYGQGHEHDHHAHHHNGH
jgi:hypothetical protein